MIASKGVIKGYFSLPAYGLMSALNAEEVMTGIHELEEVAHQMGVDTGLYNVSEYKFY